MQQPYSRSLSECRVDLYDMCLGLAETLQVSLAEFAEAMGVLSKRELAAMRGLENARPAISITKLTTIMLALQDQLNAAYFRQLQEAWPSDEVQGELFSLDDEFDDCPF